MQKLTLTPITATLLSVFLTACGGGGSGSSSSTTSTNNSTAAALTTPEQVDVISASSNTTAALTASLRSALTARAFNDAGTDYVSDEQNLHVWHPALEPVESVNSILCFIGQLQADQMINQGEYIALIDDASCDNGSSDQGSSGNQASGADQAPSFVEAIANVTQANSTSPMIINMWVPEMGDGDGEEPTKMIKARIEVTEGPSANKPFGEFHMSFGMFDNSDGSSIGGGELGTSTSSNGQLGLTLYESGEENFDGETFTFSQRASILTNAAQTAGVAVTQSVITGATLPEELAEDNFGYALSYDSARVLVNKADSFANLTADTSAATCLNRNDFHEAVWRYNLYDAATGTRVELNSGFPFSFETTPNSGDFDGRGHVGYWGVWAERNAALQNGQTIRKTSFGDDSTEEYSVVTSPGKLIKQTVTALALTELSGIDFNYYDNALGAYNQWVVNYLAADDTNANAGAGFYKVAGMTYGSENSPPQETAVTPVKITLEDEFSILSMWSQQLGGAVTWRNDAEQITYFAEEFVDGDETGVDENGIAELFAGDATSATLYCYDNCPKGTLELSDLSTFESPFDSPLYDSMGGTVTPIQYTFTRTGTNAFTLVKTTGSEPVVLANGITSDQLRETMHSWGIRSGNMVTAPLADARDIYNLAEDSVVYRWETGLDAWNKMTIIKQGDTAVTFDKPLEFRYVHSAGNDRSSLALVAGRFAGQTFLLNYGGPGQLWGIPARAVGAEGETVSGDHFRYYPAFNLKDGVQLSKGSAQYVVKAIDIEQKMVRDDLSACSTLNFNGLIEPPSELSDDYNVDIGPVPTVDDAPAVIGGEIQSAE